MCLIFIYDIISLKFHVGVNILNEKETRIINIDVENIRRKLIEIGGKKVKEENQINDIYDFLDGRLLKDKGYVRIRTVESFIDNSTHYYLTSKKLLSQDKFKVMDENETEIIDKMHCEKILSCLGLILVQSIKKFRESYLYKNTLIEIDINEKDFCPFPYIEIETQDEAELSEVVTLLGYSMEDTTSKTIYEILNDKGVNGL